MKLVTHDFRAGLAGIAVGLTVLLTFGQTAYAGSLENLERERALVIEIILNPDLSPAERQEKLQALRPRLVDLERMVLRDKKLNGRNTPTVRRAFENYDLTFLVHAATEHKLTLQDNWLSQLGLTTQSVMSASVRRR